MNHTVWICGWETDDCEHVTNAERGVRGGVPVGATSYAGRRSRGATRFANYT